jgi:hypothetical protein
MSAAYSIIRKAYSKGFKFLGAGCYSAVFDSHNPNVVIKVGADIFDPYLQYIGEVSKSDNPHFPKVKRLYVDMEKGYYIVYLEKLFIMRDEQLTQYEDIYNLAVKNKQPEKTMTKDLKEAVDIILTIVDYRSHQEIAHLRAWKDISDDASTLDLHESNIMTREDGTLVFADPLCNYKMYDVPEVEEWMHHELGITLS